MDEYTNLPLKTILQVGAESVSEESFEGIYQELTKYPQKAILIFDGLDEFNGNPVSYIDQSRVISNDPNTCMSGMNLFIKVIMGFFLREATVLVTSRPTAENFFSSFDFDRTVEIIGFTPNKVEQYVTRFCANNNRTDLKPKIWSHINSSSELLNLCYIPENCYIVCFALSGFFIHPKNYTSALPTTLTELYQTAIHVFEEYHHRNADGKSTKEEILKKLQETLKKLQLISFRGMANGQLIFDQDLLDEQTKKSGLVNSLSNPYSPVKTQFCFIHLTIQEFLAARHVTETFTPAKIKKFISNHLRSHQWHLVLEFIAGLLGKKKTMSDSEYKDCIMVFAEGFEETHDTMELNYNRVFGMKCLREGGHEGIAKEVCETTGIKDVVTLKTGLDNISPSDWEAVTFVCKHVENLSSFILFNVGSDCIKEIVKLLQKRCIDQLTLRGLYGSRSIEVEHVFDALMNECTVVNHTHANLTLLSLTDFELSDHIVSNILPFFENGHASHLKELSLIDNEISSTGISKLCKVLDSQHFVELKSLALSGSPICDEGAIVLFNTLIKGPRKLTVLRLFGCTLTGRCIPALVKTLQDEHCKLVELSLGRNEIGNEGVRLLCDNVLTKEHCKLTDLDLMYCSLTRQCISILSKALRDQRCKLNVLFLGGNDIGDKEACVLFEDALTNENCKLTQLDLSLCSLTDKCIPTLCKTLQDERCGLKTLWLRDDNDFTDNGKKMLRDVEKSNVCKARGFRIYVGVYI